MQDRSTDVYAANLDAMHDRTPEVLDTYIQLERLTEKRRGAVGGSGAGEGGFSASIDRACENTIIRAERNRARRINRIRRETIAFLKRQARQLASDQDSIIFAQTLARAIDTARALFE